MPLGNIYLCFQWKYLLSFFLSQKPLSKYYAIPNFPFQIDGNSFFFFFLLKQKTKEEIASFMQNKNTAKCTLVHLEAVKTINALQKKNLFSSNVALCFLHFLHTFICTHLSGNALRGRQSC